MTKRKLTLEMIQKYLGQEGKRYNGYVVFRENKGGFLTCMRKPNDNHGQKIYEAIMKKERGGNNELL